MKKRDYIEEIISIKNRSRFYGRHELSGRTFLIDMALKEHREKGGQFNNEFLRYIPIATVACFESFFRTIVAELIEKGEPYTENVTKFNQTTNIKFDFNIVNAIQKEKITIGDFIAHFLSCNNLNDFNLNISTLIQSDFLKELKNFQSTSIFEDATKFSAEFKQHFPRIIQSVEKTFELRHIFCHEFATNVDIDSKQINLIYEDCKLFLNQTNEFIWHLIEPNAPKTQLEMNEQASLEFSDSEAELERLMTELKNIEKDF